MKASEIKVKKDIELVKLLEEKRTEMRKIRFGVSGTKSKDSFLKKKCGRDIARILTEMKKRVG